MKIVDSIFENARSDSKKRLEKVIFQFQTEYSIAGLDKIREEICTCLVFGLYQAAMTLTNFLFENAFKTLLIYHHIYNKKALLNNFEEIELGMIEVDGILLNQSIESAYKANLITDDEKMKLMELKNKYRNAYSHAEKRKIFGQEKAIVEEFKFDKERTYSEKKEFFKSTLIPYHDFFLIGKSEIDSFEYFIFIDDIIRKIFIRLIDKNKNVPSD
jgi:hypothetical protein